MSEPVHYHGNVELDYVFDDEMHYQHAKDMLEKAENCCDEGNFSIKKWKKKDVAFTKAYCLWITNTVKCLKEIEKMRANGQCHFASRSADDHDVPFRGTIRIILEISVDLKWADSHLITELMNQIDNTEFKELSGELCTTMTTIMNPIEQFVLEHKSTFEELDKNNIINQVDLAFLQNFAKVFADFVNSIVQLNKLNKRLKKRKYKKYVKKYQRLIEGDTRYESNANINFDIKTRTAHHKESIENRLIKPFRLLQSSSRHTTATNDVVNEPKYGTLKDKYIDQISRRT